MVDSRFIHAIKIIHQLLNENNISWALIGSTNMQLQGMNVNPRDLDIVVQLKDLEQMEKIFSDYNASDVRKLPPMTDEPGWEVKIDINGVDVQILGERDTGEYVSKLLAEKLIRIHLDNIDIPCFTLEAEAQTYAETKREHKANLIREFLKK
ncbi:MAG: nucleotidyltransferase domain-containing protein [Candidatus Woesearchaeota archaeon]